MSWATSGRVCAPDVQALTAKVHFATRLAAGGRHAAAERLLREVCRALERRMAYADAARGWLELQRLLLERGRAEPAEMCGVEAQRLGAVAGDEALVGEGLVAQAWARLEQLRIVDAESATRDALSRCASGPVEVWADAALVKCLLVQERWHEVRTRLQRCRSLEGLCPVEAAIVAEIRTEAWLATGDGYAATRCAVDAVTRSAGASALARAIALSARLRVLVASGELEWARETLTAAVGAAREARAPIRRLRTLAVWCVALQRVGDVASWRDEVRRARRLWRMMPPLVAQETLRARTPSPSGITGEPAEAPRHLRDLIVTAQTDGPQGLLATLSVVRHLLGVPRAEIWLPGHADPLAASGEGAPSDAGPSALRVGAAAQTENHLAVPIRYQGEVVGALAVGKACALSSASLDHWMGVVADLLAPHVEARWLAAREHDVTGADATGLLGPSSAMAAIRGAVARAARAPFSVLIEGESGVGKELVARAIHQLSPRVRGRFCDVNCAAIPDELCESELFGHASGAFTGAARDRAGLFEEAHHGTLFLDEVAELSPRAQAKLLRAIQQQEIRRVGETTSRTVDVRLVAAANRRLAEEVACGRFRADLLYRLDVIHIAIPPLRERPGDVIVLARALWMVAASGVGSSARLAPATLEALASYSWPGNVRELQNVLAALAVTAPHRGRIGTEWLPPSIRHAGAPSPPTFAAAREAFERAFVAQAMARACGNHARAARQMGLSRQGLLKMLARLGLRGH